MKKNKDEFKEWISDSDIRLLISARCSELAETCEQLNEFCIQTEYLDTVALRYKFYKRLFDLNRDIQKFISCTN